MATQPQATFVESSTSPVSRSLAELAGLLGRFTLCQVVGNGDVKVSRLVHPTMIEGSDDLPAILAVEAVQALQMAKGMVKAALVAKGVDIPEGLVDGYVVAEDPRKALAVLLKVFKKVPHHYDGVHPTAVVDASVTLHPTVKVGPCSVIGPNVVIGEDTVIASQVTLGADVKVGSGCFLHSGVRVGDRCELGSNVMVHYNVSIGADGFSFVTEAESTIESAKKNNGRILTENKDFIKIESVGNVVIEDDVEIGANTTIDRANLGSTRIGRGTKIDNLVMIAHNNTVGKDCLIIAQVGIAGSCNIGDGAVIAGQAGLKDHLKVGSNSIVMAQSGLMWDVPEKSSVMGSPAVPQREHFKREAQVAQLGEMRRELKRLNKRLAALEVSSCDT